MLKNKLFWTILALNALSFSACSHKERDARCLEPRLVKKLEGIVKEDISEDVCVQVFDEEDPRINFRKVVEEWEKYKKELEERTKPGECQKAVRILMQEVTGLSYDELKKLGYADGTAWYVIANAIRSKNQRVYKIYMGKGPREATDSLVNYELERIRDLKLDVGDLIAFYYPGSNYNDEARRVLGPGNEATHIGLIVGVEVSEDGKILDYYIAHNFPAKRYKGFHNGKERIRIDRLSTLLRQTFKGYNRSIKEELIDIVKKVMGKEERGPYEKNDGILYLRYGLERKGEN